MKLLRFVFIGLLYMLNLGCSATQALSGLYQTTKGQEIAFSGTNIKFLAHQEFELQQWSDDISSNKEGKGTYRIENKQLILSFAAYAPPEANVEAKPIIPSSTTQHTGVLLVTTTEEQPLIGVTVILKNDSEKIIASGISNQKGYVEIVWPLSEIPQKLMLSYLGFNSIEVDIKQNTSFKYDIKMAPVSQYYSAGDELVFQLKTKKGKFILSNDRRTRTFYKKD